MKFIYCPECKDLRPRSWYHFGDCVICGNKSRVIAIPMSIRGYMMYVLSAIGAMFVIMEVLAIDMGLGDVRLVIMFGSLALAMAFSFLEIDRATKLAMEKVGKVL